MLRARLAYLSHTSEDEYQNPQLIAILQHLSAFIVSSKLASLGLMQAIMSVRLLPPRESCRMRVSLLSRYLQPA